MDDWNIGNYMIYYTMDPQTDISAEDEFTMTSAHRVEHGWALVSSPCIGHVAASDPAPRVNEVVEIPMWVPCFFPNA